MKILNGAEVAEFIKERQARQVRALKQAHNVFPHLAIIRTNPDTVVDSYMKLKQSYGDDIGVEVSVHTINQADALAAITSLNNDQTVHGIIVQLPLPDPAQTTELLDTVALSKDVDGLATDTSYEAPTPLAIQWLLAAYNTDLKDKTIAVVGQGRLVGAPLSHSLEISGNNVLRIDSSTPDMADKITQADIIISAVGKPGLITNAMLKDKAVVVDAGVATDNNGLIGDVAEDVRTRDDIAITPEKGGVGPLTVCALFENVLKSATAAGQSV
jgi:methylenetetrahydrofolate dehydrogenase (NADP+) / methenyltetrahydrofolate cyclohydrolase